MKRGRRKSKLWLWLVIGIATAVLIGLTTVRGVGANVALIKVEGLLISTKQSSFVPYEVCSTEQLIKQIQEALQTPAIKALLIEINSAGGSAVAASEVAQAIKQAKASKPVVALIREQGTSGAYWVASSSSWIIAHPLSVTGSIGVTASYLEIAGLLERFNVSYERLVKGEHKDVLSPFRQLTDKERELVLEKLDIVYRTFIQEVAENRNLTQSQVKELADGMFLLGKEAKELGLVDQLGTKKDAIRWIEEQLNITAQIKEYKKEENLLERLARFYSQSAFWLGRGIGASLADKDLLRSLSSISPQT